MPKRPSIYRRLTGRKRTLLGYSQLWLAPDHLMLVKSVRFSEQYQRFALADIQSIVITNPPEDTRLQIGLAGAALLWTLIAFAVSSLFAKIFFVATGALALAFVIRDIARGPRCHCHLYTAVSRERLEPVNRQRTARAFLAELRPAIEAVQGAIAADRVLEAPAPSAQSFDSPPEVPQPRGFLPELVFGLFLVNAVLLLVDVRFPRSQAASVLLTTVFGELALIVFALVRRPGRDPRRVIYGVMIVALWLIAWDAFDLARSFYQVVAEASRHGNSVAFDATWNPWGQKRALISAAWRVAAGAVGLIASYIER